MRLSNRIRKLVEQVDAARSSAPGESPADLTDDELRARIAELEARAPDPCPADEPARAPASRMTDGELRARIADAERRCGTSGTA